MAEEHINNTTNAGRSPPDECESPETEWPARSQEVAGLAAPIAGVAVPGEREQRPAEESQAVAEEQTSTSGVQQQPVTEKPVATQRKISQYTVSVDDATGAIIKIEKLDEQTGQSREFTSAEYATAYSFASSAAPYYAAYAASLYDPLSSPAVQAYLQAMSNCIRALTATR